MRIWLMLMLCLLMPCQALAEADFLDFPWSQETAPAAPMQAGYAQDGSGYHDGSLDIDISEMEVPIAQLLSSLEETTGVDNVRLLAVE